MKNLTITVDDGVLEWARIEAAKRNTSVSRLVGEMLAEKMRRDDAYGQAMREANSPGPAATPSAGWLAAALLPGRWIAALVIFVAVFARALPASAGAASA